MQSPPLIFSTTVQAGATPLSLAALSNQSLATVVRQFPALLPYSAWQQSWHSPVVELRVMGETRVWALAESPESGPVVRFDSPRIDELDVLHLPFHGCGQRHELADLPDLSRRLIVWSDDRAAYWYRLVNSGCMPLRDRQRFMQWIAPLERRLRDALILTLWRQSLQGEILLSPSFATGHPMTLPLVRWVLAPRKQEGRQRRRQMVRRARGVIALLLALLPTSRSGREVGLRVIARLFRRPKCPTKRQIATALTPVLKLPAWTIRRAMAFDWSDDPGNADVALDDLQRLSRHLPPEAWPRDLHSLCHARRCLKAMNGMLCFGLFDCETWPANQRIPGRVRSWMLRELRVCHGGDWGRFAEALEAKEPRYQTLVWMLPDLSQQWWHVHWDEPDAMERISAPWRTASPEWWLQRLPQWWATVTARNDALLGLRWRPMFVGRRQHGHREAHCMHTLRRVRRLLDRHGCQHLMPWLGPSLVARAQWVLFDDVLSKQPRSMALLHATTRGGELLVELIAHVSLDGTDTPSLECDQSLQLLWRQWEQSHWGVLSRVESEAVLKEDEEMCLIVERTRIKAWSSIASIGANKNQ